MTALTNEEKETLMELFTNNIDICNDEDKWWAMNGVRFCDIPIEILKKLDIENQPDLKNEPKEDLLIQLTSKEECESGFHVYWDLDEEGNAMANIGLFYDGGGDGDFDFTLKDILGDDYYNKLVEIGSGDIHNEIMLEKSL